MAVVRYCARCVSVWLILIFCAGVFVPAAQASSDCPLDFSGLDFTATIAACANVSYGSCCDHSKALVAVAMSQYTRNTSNLQLPVGLRQPCVSHVAAVWEENDIQLPVATWCALNASVLVDSPCRGITSAKSIHELPDFSPLESSCGHTESLNNSVTCQHCLNSQARFHGNLTENRRISESWNSCAHTVFLAVASLGDSDFAMEHANCFFQLQAPNAAFLPQSRCPVILEPGQITYISDSCNGPNGNRFKCCASALLELRISLVETPPTSEVFYISTRQGDACLKDLDSALLTQEDGVDLHRDFQACNIAPEDIFHNSTHGCHGISTMEEIHSMLLEHDFDHRPLHEYCSTPWTSCEQCRRSVLEAASVLASAGGPDMKSTVLQSCSDLLFLSLARNSTQAKAMEIGSCLYDLRDIVEPTPAPSSPIVVMPKVVLLCNRLMKILFGISMGVMTLLLIFVVMASAKSYCKEVALCSPITEEPSPLGASSLANDEPEDAFDNAADDAMQLTRWARMRTRILRTVCPSEDDSEFKHFRLSEIQRATDNFSAIIGRGGYGTVYKARFQDGLVAAVKRANEVTSQGEREFRKEMETLGIVTSGDRRLVGLRGYCAVRHERFLVYEYCENGSLNEHLHHNGHPNHFLTWQERMQIAFDIASCLDFLHSICNPPLCHRDIKSSNILLDGSLNAKIADLRLHHAGRSGNAMTTGVGGTPGYVDPEYERTHELTAKSDVYSFGVLLLELVSGRPAITDGIRLADATQRVLYEDDTFLTVDPRIESLCPLRELKTIIAIIMRCTQNNGKQRPTIRQVARWLSGIIPMTISPSSRFPARPGEVPFPPEGQ